jgi:hypothetical protein
MTKYKIVSPRIGEPGSEYDAERAAATGVNVDALIAAGFIAAVSAPKPAKNAKKELETDEEN